MLTVLTTAEHAYTIRDFLERGGTKLTGRVITLTYGEFLSWQRLPAGHYILADVDRLPPSLHQAVAKRIEALRAALPRVQVLNHPQRSLGRYALLDQLHRAGTNRFDVRRASESAEGLRYPLFVRAEVEHSGALSPLLRSQEELLAALAGLKQTGVALADCLLVEFIDTRNDQGLYEKRSVMRIGERFFATERSVNTAWICKGEEDEFNSDEWRAKDLLFQRDNPDLEQVRPLFELAGIDYGRIDYGFADGQLQVFEINSNPTIKPPASVAAISRPSLELHAQNFVEAMTPLLGAVSSRYYVALAAATGNDRVEAPNRFRLVLRTVLRSLQALHHEHRIIGLLNHLRGKSGPR